MLKLDKYPDLVDNLNILEQDLQGDSEIDFNQDTAVVLYGGEWNNDSNALVPAGCLYLPPKMLMIEGYPHLQETLANLLNSNQPHEYGYSYIRYTFSTRELKVIGYEVKLTNKVECTAKL